MSLEPAAVTSRANSDLCAADLLMARTDLPSPVRMALLERIVEEWRAATGGSTGRAAAHRQAAGLTRIGNREVVDQDRRNA